jgi:hydroxymethylbilane synthase
VKQAEIRIGTRGSALALIQARLAADAFAREGRATRLVMVETAGDRRAPDTAWGEGAFVKSIERALLDGRVDVAVHSAKDVPTVEDARLRIGAYLPRADARDALVVRDTTCRSIDDLTAGAVVGTDSPRRSAFLLARRPDLHVRPLHGNVDTRLRRLDAGESDALILASAGIDRLGHGDRIAQRIDVSWMPPAPGQGAIALQVRSDDAKSLALTAALDDHVTRVAVEAERGLLHAAGGGCRAPIGAFGVVRGGELSLLAGHAQPDGTGLRIGRRDGSVREGSTIALALYRELWADDVALELAT